MPIPVAHSFLVAVSTALVLVVGAGPAAALQQGRCGDRASLAVTIRDDSGLIAIPNSTVVLRWTDAVRRPVRQAADSGGSLILCVPRDARQATLWAEFGDASSEEAVIVLEPGAAHDVELRFRFGEMTTGRLLGQVVDAGSKRPVATAAVSVTGRVEAVQTNRRGQFIFSGLPVGEYEMSIRHIGYVPLTHAVTVTRGHTTEVQIGLSPDPVALEPLVATVMAVTRPRRLEIKGFYERKYWGELTGGGAFFTAADIERRAPLRITHMVADAPGVRLANCDIWGHGCKLYSTTASRGFSDKGCKLNIFLDGNMVIRGSKERWSLTSGGGMDSNPRESINDYVLPTEIAGIEVYTGAASLPAEFGGFDSRCGAVVLWTK